MDDCEDPILEYLNDIIDSDLTRDPEPNEVLNVIRLSRSTSTFSPKPQKTKTTPTRSSVIMKAHGTVANWPNFALLLDALVLVYVSLILIHIY